jgi:dTDP-4-dehydrorhamnose reductase
MRIIVIGSTGQLGTDLVRVLKNDHEVVGLTHEDIEVVERDSCQILREYSPDVVINTAAFHNVDQCEEEPLKAFSVNAIGAKNIAEVCREIQATTIFISTDYVFDGSKTEPYTEEDIPNPINTYGISKLAGELFTIQNPRHYIIRVASLFGTAGARGKGGNFIDKIITKARNNEHISVVDDIWMSPTYTVDAAKVINIIIKSRMPFGIYHVTNTGCCTWFQFAQEIFRQMGLKPHLTPIKAQQLQMKARRPIYSVLTSIKLPKYDVKIRDWRQALNDYLIEKGYLSASSYSLKKSS